VSAIPTVQGAVIDLLRTRGMTTIFGNPGSTGLPPLDRLPADFRYVLGLPEAVVVGLADGYAQAAGRTALVNLHTGAGACGAMGAIFTAAANRTPLVITAGRPARAGPALGALLTNAEAIVPPRPAVKWAYEPPRPQDVPGALMRALHLAETPPRGPVFVSLPLDDLDVELSAADAAQAAAVIRRRVTHRAAPDPAAITALARRLENAADPVLITGGDVDASGAWDVAVALAERCALPVWAAPGEGRGSFPENHPNFRGFLPPAIGPLSDLLAGHDLVVVAGAPVFRHHPRRPDAYLPAGADLVQLTCDAAEAARAPAGDAIVGDVRLALEALLGATSAAPRRPPPGAYSGGVARRVRAAPQPPAETGFPMAASDALAALARAVPADAIWVNESPSTIQVFQDQIRPGRPGSFLLSAGGGLGFGLPAAVGAQLGNRSRSVVAVMGDGSMQYAIPALWTAAAYRVPVTVVVLAGHEYAISTGPGVPGIDICSIAAGYGIPAHRADGPEELAKSVHAALGSAGPALIEVEIAPVPTHVARPAPARVAVERS
jgi:benzoylformate decarboxylase